MKEYILLAPNEDGDPIMMMTKDEVNEYLEECKDVEFRDNFHHMNTNYWKESEVMIIKIDKIIKPKVKLSI